jgi:hypothetical protein
MIKSWRITWVEHVARIGKNSIIYIYILLVGNPEGRKPQGRTRRRWVDNTEMDFEETAWDGVHWFSLVQDRDQWRAIVNAVMNFRVPKMLEIS